MFDAKAARVTSAGWPHVFAAISPDSDPADAPRRKHDAMAAEQTSRTQLMLAIEASDGASERLAAVLAALPVSVVVVVPVAGRTLVAADVLPLIATGQAGGAAVLVEGDAQLARTCRADGVHIGFAEELGEPFEAARGIVGGRAIVGADAGRSRHTAMSLGELGADFVAFGVPVFVKDRETAFERQCDLVAWWSEIFEIPCVAMDVVGPDEAAELAGAGADFVCATIRAGISAGDAVALARAFATAIGPEARTPA